MRRFSNSCRTSCFVGRLQREFTDRDMSSLSSRLTYNRSGNLKRFVASPSTEYARRYVEGCRMKRTGTAKSLAIPAVVVLASLTLAATGSAESGEPLPWTGPVPRANCGPGDRTERGMQGETTRQERLSGDS